MTGRMQPWRFVTMDAPGWYVVMRQHARRSDHHFGYVGRVSQFLWQAYDWEGEEIGTPTYSRGVAAGMVHARAYNTYREAPFNN